MTNKKKEWLRILIFTVIAFAPMWITAIILNKKVGFEIWFTDSKYAFTSILLMFPPAIANILTRLITREGFENSYLHLRLKGNIKYYILALILPVICGLVSDIIVSVCFGRLDFKEIFSNNSPVFMSGIILTVFGLSAPISWYTFGEEFGWRAYLYPKLEKLTGTPWACLLGGVIWGVWHAPLTVAGHNFGTEYRGFPYMGIVLMTLFCVADGAFLMWVTKKTGSVYPASIWHAVNNNGGTAMVNLFMNGVDADSLNQIQHHIVIMLPNLISGIIFFILLIKDSRKTKIKS